MVKAVALVSGGLDSTIAMKIVGEHGVDIDAVNYYTGFCIAEHRRKIKRSDGRSEALRAGVDAGVEISIVDVSEEYLRVVAHPKYGYGSAINPCIDCRIFMLRNAKERMIKTGADFVFTGEVLGQRPMSQHMHQLRLIERESGLEGLLLRPLSAKLLPPTIPEKAGWVNREKLYAVSGRGRKEQFKLAVEYGIADYPQPSGGCCFLTDKNYARRLRDLFDYRGKDSVTTEDVILLKVGRHFRISEHAKAIVGRDENENGFLMDFTGSRCILRTLDVEGPLTLLEGDVTEHDLKVAAGITARYSDANKKKAVRVEFRRGSDSGVLEVKSMGDELELLRI